MLVPVVGNSQAHMNYLDSRLLPTMGKAFVSWIEKGYGYISGL